MAKARRIFTYSLQTKSKPKYGVFMLHQICKVDIDLSGVRRLALKVLNAKTSALRPRIIPHLEGYLDNTHSWKLKYA